MLLSIAQYNASVIAELQLRFHDNKLTSADRHIIHSVASLIETLGHIRIVLPVDKLSMEQQQQQRDFISQISNCRDWNNFLQRNIDLYKSLRRQEQMIVSFVPYFELGEMAEAKEFKGIYTKETLKGFRKRLYNDTGIRDKAGYIDFCRMLNITPRIPAHR